MKTNFKKTIKKAAVSLIIAASFYAGAATRAELPNQAWLEENAELYTSPIDGQEYYKLDDMLFPVPAKAPEGVEAAAFNPTYTKLWPSTTIPYRWSATIHPGNGYPDVILEDTLTQDQKNKVLTTFRAWELGTGLHFVETDDENNNFIIVTNGDENMTTTGVNQYFKANQVSIKNWYTWVIAHEIGHSLGLNHEHERNDRDNYITTHQENAIQGTQLSKNQLVEGITNYDYVSIMHYQRNAGSINGLDTITCNAGYEQYQDVIGQLCMISALDRTAVAKLYGTDLPTCSISISTSDPKLGSINAGGTDALRTFDASLLTLANPGVPITLTLSTTSPDRFQGWEAENADVDDAGATTVNITPRGDCSVRAVFKTYQNVFEGTTGSILSVDFHAAFPNATATNSFGSKVTASIGGKKAKITGGGKTASIEVTPTLCGGTYPIMIVDKLNGASGACSLMVKPPDIATATYSGTTLTIVGNLFGKKTTVTVDGKKKTGKNFFNQQSGASTTTVSNVKLKPTTVIITNKAGTDTAKVQ